MYYLKFVYVRMYYMCMYVCMYVRRCMHVCVCVCVSMCVCVDGYVYTLQVYLLTLSTDCTVMSYVNLCIIPLQEQSQPWRRTSVDLVLSEVCRKLLLMSDNSTYVT